MPRNRILEAACAFCLRRRTSYMAPRKNAQAAVSEGSKVSLEPCGFLERKRPACAGLSCFRCGRLPAKFFRTDGPDAAFNRHLVGQGRIADTADTGFDSVGLRRGFRLGDIRQPTGTELVGILQA